MIKYRILSVCLILLGILSVLIDNDATFCIFTLILGVPLFFSKPEWFE